MTILRIKIKIFSIKEKITNETAKFFGICEDYNSLPIAEEDTSLAFEEERKWQQRRFRHLNRKYGIKTEIVAEEMQPKLGILNFFIYFLLFY